MAGSSDHTEASSISAKGLPRLPEYRSQLDFAVPEIAKELLKGLQAARPSHDLFKLIDCLFTALFFKKGRQCVSGHFQAIPQRKCLGPRNGPQGNLDLPGQLIFLVIEFVIHSCLLPPNLRPKQLGGGLLKPLLRGPPDVVPNSLMPIPSLTAVCRIKLLHDGAD